MLTFEENRWNFRAIEILSNWNFLPIGIDTKTGKICMANPWRLFTWKFSFAFVSFHWIYVAVRLAQSIWIPQYFKLDHFALHLIFIIGLFFANSLGFFMFVRNPNEFVITFNRLFQCQPNNNKEDEDDQQSEDEDEIINRESK